MARRYKSLCISDSEIQIWQITVPTLAFKHDYLMNGILVAVVRRDTIDRIAEWRQAAVVVL
jgi:hypothetical protein